MQTERDPPPPQSVFTSRCKPQMRSNSTLGGTANHFHELALEGADPAASRRFLPLFAASGALHRAQNARGQEALPAGGRHGLRGTGILRRYSLGYEVDQIANAASGGARPRLVGALG